MSDEIDRQLAAACRRRNLRRPRGVVPQRVEGRPEAGQDARDAPDPGPVGLAERPGDARPDADLALAGVVQEARHEDVPFGQLLGPEAGHDVEAVALVGDMHPVEDGLLLGGGPGQRVRPAPRVARAPRGDERTGGF